jgi:hypothetical protein
MVSPPFAGEGEREVGQVATGRRFEGGRGQRTIQIRFVKPAQPKAGRRRVIAQPAEGELVLCGEHDERVGRDMPVGEDIGVRDRELERGVNGLTCLRSRRQISTGNDVEGGRKTLPVWHVIHGTRSAKRPDVTLLPRCLDRARVVVATHIRDRLAGWYSIQDRQAGQGRTGAPAPTTARDLDPARGRALPRFAQRVLGLGALDRQPEVGPA